MSNPYTEILNQILSALLPKINDAIGGAIKEKGLDPYKHVASGSKSFGIGKASYSVTNLTGLSSIEIKAIKASNVSGSGANLSGDMAMFVKMTSNLGAKISGDVKILFADPGISGSLKVKGATVSGEGGFSASVDGTKVCLNKINITTADFNYTNASASIDGAGIINDILKPLENLILDAVKGDIRNLVSGEVKSVLNEQVDGFLPQCTNL